MIAKPDPRADTSREIARLRDLLSNAQATLHAIRSGNVDAVVVDGKFGPQVFTLDGAEFDYRALIESMNEGALVLTRGSLILYANAHFARMAERPLEHILGRSVLELITSTDQRALRRLLKRPNPVGAAMDLSLERPNGAPMPAHVSVRPLPNRVAKDVSIGMVVSDLTEVRKREDLMRAFSHALLKMQETERRQVATDLGDNITQLLCVILVRCQALADRLPAYEAGLRTETAEFTKLLRTTAEEVHRISANLRPHGLEVLGLVSALRAVIAEFAVRIGGTLRVSFDPVLPCLRAPAELAIYRIVQESLRNVEQHARARHVSVTLKQRGAELHLLVKDDGIGFDTSDRADLRMQAERFGLLSMRERARAAGGELKVKSSASAGTEVRLIMPVVPMKPG